MRGSLWMARELVATHLLVHIEMVFLMLIYLFKTSLPHRTIWQLPWTVVHIFITLPQWHIYGKYLVLKWETDTSETLPLKRFFWPPPLRPKGYCRRLRPSVCPYDQDCPHDISKNICRIFLKNGCNIPFVNMSDRFDDGYRSSLNMALIDQKVLLTFLLSRR